MVSLGEFLQSLTETLQQIQTALTRSEHCSHSPALQEVAHRVDGIAGKLNTLHMAPPTFPAFDRSVEPWSNYVERLEQHLLAHGIHDENRSRAFFLATVGPQVYRLIQQLNPEQSPRDLSYSHIKGCLYEYFDAQIHVTSARQAFFSCRKAPGQTYREWITTLQCLSRDCKFRCANVACKQSYASSLIRDMVVFHAPDEGLRADILKLQDPSLDTCLPIIRAFEQSVARS